MNGKEKSEVVKFVNNNIEIDVNVNPEEETIWLSIDQMKILFDRDKSVISRHITNIFTDFELDENSCVAFFATELKKYDPRTKKDRLTIVNIKYYNLEVILAVGYRVYSKNGIIFRQWANSVLKQYLLKGYVINENRTLVTNDNYVRLINKVESMDERISNIENIIVNKKIPTEKIFYNGEIYDAYSLLQQLFEQANNEIIIIDNFVDRTILDRLVVKKKNVKVVIYTDPSKSHLFGNDIKVFNKQYPSLDLRYSNLFHDRSIIIDKIELYLIRASLKDVGKKCFAMSKLENKDILNNLIKQYNL